MTNITHHAAGRRIFTAYTRYFIRLTEAEHNIASGYATVAPIWAYMMARSRAVKVGLHYHPGAEPSPDPAVMIFELLAQDDTEAERDKIARLLVEYLTEAKLHHEETANA